MTDSVLLLALLTIVLSSLLGVFVARRKKDQCVKDFQGYMVTAVQRNGKRVWGRLAVETSGIELRYRGNYWDEDHVEASSQSR